MVSFDEKIDQYFEEADRSVNQILQGSDEHLDLILSFTAPLKDLAVKMKTLNEKLLEILDGLDPETIEKQVLPKMRELNKSCLQLVGTLYRSSIYRDVREALKLFNIEHDAYRETLHDIQNYRLKHNPELQSLMLQIGSL